jgi:FixJ family two-component response regulator
MSWPRLAIRLGARGTTFLSNASRRWRPGLGVPVAADPGRGLQRHGKCTAALGREIHEVANVLIVDDNVDVTDVLSVLLKSVGYHVRVAHSGKEGLALLSAAPLPDCLLLDVEMPVLSGPGMAHQMLLHDAGEEKVPILLVSGRNDLPAVAALMGTPYFLKKTSANYGKVLLEILARALREKLAPASA